MVAPVLQNFTQLRGNLTEAGWGDVPFSGTPLLVAANGTISTWSITLTGGTSGHWTTPTNGWSPAPTSAGDSANLNGGPYTFNVTATNADGVSNTAVLTINIEANSYTISKFSDVGTSSTGLRRPAVANNLGGKIVRLARGAQAVANGNNQTTLQGQISFINMRNHTGRWTLSSEDETAGNRSVSYTRWVFGACQRVDVQYIEFETYIAYRTPPPPPTPPPGKGGQTTAAVTVQLDTGVFSSDMTFKHMKFGAPVGTSGNQWTTGLSIVNGSNFVVQDIQLTRVCQGILATSVTDSTFDGITVDSYSANGFFGSGTGYSRNTHSDYVAVRPFTNICAPTDHRDAFQIGSSSSANYTDNVFQNMLFCQADGDCPSQGIPYADDVYFTNQHLTGFYQNNNFFRNVFSDSVAFQGFHLDGGSGDDVQACTLVRGKCTSAAENASGAGVPFFGGSAAQGTVKNNIWNTRQDLMLVNFPSLDTDNCISSQKATMPANTIWLESARVAYLAATFYDPGRAIDYPNLTARQIAAEVAIAYSPKPTGPARKVDGSYHGRWFPYSGSGPAIENDLTIFEASPPTTYTLAVLDTAIIVGQPCTVMVQLDAIAVTDTTVTLTRSGTATGNSPIVIVIPTGQASGTGDFTATGVGTATLTPSDNQGMTDPAPLVLTASAAVNPPTSYTLTVNQAAIALGGQYLFTATLNNPAVATTTISITFPMAGVAAPTTIILGEGQTTGQMTYLPTEVGSGFAIPSDDKGLTDPANVFLSATPLTKGQLLRIFDRMF